MGVRGICGAWREACAFWALPFGTGINVFPNGHQFRRGVVHGAAAECRRRIGVSLWAATIGALMPLVPGMALTNAMREIMAGDLISGLNRTAEAILVATAIALGTVLPLVIGQVHNDGMQQPAPGRPACGPALPVWASDRYSTSRAGAFGSVASARRWAGWRIWRPLH